MGSVLAPFLNIGFNLTILHFSRKIGSFIDKYIIFIKIRANTSAPSFGNLAGIWSTPMSLLV